MVDFNFPEAMCIGAVVGALRREGKPVETRESAHGTFRRVLNRVIARNRDKKELLEFGSSFLGKIPLLNDAEFTCLITGVGLKLIEHPNQSAKKLEDIGGVFRLA